MEKTRFGIIGTGRISDWVLKGAVLKPRFEAAAVCSRSKESAERFAAGHHIQKTYTDVEAMASDPSIDAIYIGTPNNTHKDLAILCMRKGKHVLCEKPLASNAREVEEMMAVAKENGVVLMEAMISTLNPNFRNAKEKMAQIGPIRHFFASFCQYSSKLDLLKRIISGEESAPVPSSLNPMASGGVTMDIGTYTIYPMVSLFGRPESIKANLVCWEVPTEKGPQKIDLQGSVQFTYPGMLASVMYSKLDNSRLRTEISGDKGIITLDQIHITRDAELVERGAPTSGRASGPQAQNITVPADGDEYQCEFREFIDVVQSGNMESRINSLETSLAVAEVMDEIRHQAGVVFPAD